MKNLQLSLSGKAALITGAAGGLGASLAEYFGAAGAKLFLSSLHEEKLQGLSDSLKRENIQSQYHAADITDPAACAETVDLAVERLGGLDILVNCAGVNRPQNAVDVTEKDWDDVLDVNLKSIFFLCQAAAKKMIPRGGGKIVNISSQAGLVALPLRAAYCSSKGGVNQLTRELACEWARYNINVNAVAPTFVQTAFTSKMFEDASFRKFVIESIPLGRMAEASDVAYAALFLSSDFAKMITGHILSVDGGWTIK